MRKDPGILKAPRDVADTDFPGAEVVMGADITPDFPDRVDKAGVDEVGVRPIKPDLNWSAIPCTARAFSSKSLATSGILAQVLELISK